MSRLAQATQRWWFVAAGRFGAGRMAIYAGVVSLVGVDAFALIVGSAALWPVGIPFLIAGLALVYAIRGRWPTARRRFVAGGGSPVADGSRASEGTPAGDPSPDRGRD